MSDHEDGASLARITEARTVLEARSASLRLRIKKGEMVRRQAAERTIAELALRVRDAVMSAPARYAAVLAAEIDAPPALMLAALDGLLRRALSRLADEGDREMAEAAAARGEASFRPPD